MVNSIHTRIATHFQGHDMIVNAILLSKSTAVTTGWDGRVKKWDIEKEKEIDQVNTRIQSFEIDICVMCIRSNGYLCSAVSRINVFLLSIRSIISFKVELDKEYMNALAFCGESEDEVFAAGKGGRIVKIKF